jgi:nucleoside-diphosphate-sugar epimerase
VLPRHFISATADPGDRDLETRRRKIVIDPSTDTMISRDDNLVFRLTICEQTATTAKVTGGTRMKVFVTGVSGYAGFYAALRLAAAGHTVTGLVRNPEQPRLNVLRVQQIELLHGDVGDPGNYRSALEGSDVVIHTMLDKKRPLETDRALFAALQALPVRNPRRRFIYTTGCSIFGKLPIPVMDESTEPNPDHPLAFRRTLEKEALTIANIGTVVLRPGFMFGNDGYNSVAADWFEMAEAGDAVFRGDRERGWSWIHIADLAAAYQLAAEADDGVVAGEVFHVADDLLPRSLEVMRACVGAAGYQGEVRLEGPTKGDNISTWFNQNEFISPRKAHDRLGWRSRHPGIIESAKPVYAAWKAARTQA